MEYLFLNNGAELNGDCDFTCGCYNGNNSCSHCETFKVCGARAPICGVDIPECPLKLTDL